MTKWNPSHTLFLTHNSHLMKINICIFFISGIGYFQHFNMALRHSFHNICKSYSDRSYNVVSFLPNSHKIHPIPRQLGWGMGCILCAQNLIYMLLQSLQWCMRLRYHVIILDCIITALDCISKIIFLSKQYFSLIIEFWRMTICERVPEVNMQHCEQVAVIL